MSLVLAVLVAVAFAFGIDRLRFPDRAREVVERGLDCLEILRDRSMDEDEKSAGLQNHAIRLFGLVGIFLGGGLLALALPLGGVWVLDRAGVGSFAKVLAVLQSPAFLVAAFLVGTLAYVLFGRGDRR